MLIILHLFKQDSFIKHKADEDGLRTQDRASLYLKSKKETRPANRFDMFTPNRFWLRTGTRTQIRHKIRKLQRADVSQTYF